MQLDAFATHCGLHPDTVRRLVALGLLACRQDARGDLWLEPSALAAVARIQRLRTDLGLNHAAIGLVLDLLDSVDDLERELKRRSKVSGTGASPGHVSATARLISRKTKDNLVLAQRIIHGDVPESLRDGTITSLDIGSPVAGATCPKCGSRNRAPACAQAKPRCALCHQWLPWIAESGDDDFTEIVETSSVPVLVDVWATWCGSCRVVSPALVQLATERAGQLKLVKVDVDRAPAVTQQFAVQAVPTLLVLNDYEVLGRRSGAAPVTALRNWLDTVLVGTRTKRHPTVKARAATDRRPDGGP